MLRVAVCWAAILSSGECFMIQKPGSSTATCSCNVLVQKMVLSILSHGGFAVLNFLNPLDTPVLWIHTFLLTWYPLITSLSRISYDLPWCRHGYFLEPNIGSKCTLTFNKAVLTVVSFVGKIPCLVTIVRIVVPCFLVLIMLFLSQMGGVWVPCFKPK